MNSTSLKYCTDAARVDFQKNCPMKSIAISQRPNPPAIGTQSRESDRLYCGRPLRFADKRICSLAGWHISALTSPRVKKVPPHHLGSGGRVILFTCMLPHYYINIQPI